MKQNLKIETHKKENLFVSYIIIWRLPLSIPNLFGSVILKPRHSAAILHPPFWWQPLCDYYERSEYVLINFVVKVSVHFRVNRL